MTTAIVQRHCHSEVEVELEDGTQVSVTDYGDVETDELLADRRVDGKIVVSYLARDDSQRQDDPLAEDEAVEFILFNNGGERDHWIDEHLHACTECGYTPDYDHEECGGYQAPTEWPALFASKRAHWVERYEHGLVRYALSHESSQVDRQWDVASGVAVLVLDADWVDDPDRRTEIARSLLDTYTSWCNGDVWGVCHFVIDPDTGETVEDDACWGYIGDEYALEELNSGHKNYMEAT
jgi:hypothetical protein